MTACRRVSRDVPVMVKRPPVTAGFGMKRATPSSFRIALFSVSRCSGVMPGKMSTPWRVGTAGLGAWNDDLCRLSAGEGDRLVGEGERRRFEGGAVEMVMGIAGVVVGSGSLMSGWVSGVDGNGCDSVVVGLMSLASLVCSVVFTVVIASRDVWRYFCRCGVSSMTLLVHMCRAVLLSIRESCSSVSWRVCHPVGVEGMA